ncbi:DUF2975 domain-containing protein [Senegalia massiliensis]|uniref:DUF2975 domain-containing protein n=1 Tax=Senegalia massiliensis TaxID=1720316 RepID=A0A845QYC8_9CLOT|nr:DUF2975 domain-containing protein [Senegalia massiliensis]NBI07271.1 DUF2975 domain-containing protein [Senegalia massiliensis]
MKNKKRIRFLNGFLNIILVFTTLLFIILIFSAFKTADRNIINIILEIILGLIFFGSYFMITFTLKKILKLIRDKNPFNINNITYFKRIGYYIFIVGVTDAIINYPKPTNLGFEIMSTQYGSLKPIFFLYLVLSILSLILSDVFRMAMEIKQENDLTV